MSGPELVRRPPIEHVGVEHVELWLRQVATTLLGNPYDDDFPRRIQRWARKWDPARTWGARERGRWVATLATETRTLTVPGAGITTRDLAVDAVTAVTVAATHRRRGLLTAMIGESLQAAKDRGDPLSILIAAEWPIYGRFGFAPATTIANYRYRPRQSGLSVDVDRTSVRQIEPAELGPLAARVFDAARRRRTGQVDRHTPWWDRQLGLDGYDAFGDAALHWFVHDGPDGPDGMLAWKVARDFDLDSPGSITVSSFAAMSAVAERDLWDYLSGIDAIDEIGLGMRPVDEPLQWWLRDARALVQTSVVDFLWLRLLDVPAALAARHYATDGRVVLEVRDDDPGAYARGRFALDVRDGVATCTPTDAAPDLSLDQRTLASCYLGGHRLLALASVGQPAENAPAEYTPGALARLDLMLSTPLAPFTQTGF